MNAWKPSLMREMLTFIASSICLPRTGPCSAGSPGCLADVMQAQPDSTLHLLLCHWHTWPLETWPWLCAGDSEGWIPDLRGLPIRSGCELPQWLASSEPADLSQRPPCCEGHHACLRHTPGEELRFGAPD